VTIRLAISKYLESQSVEGFCPIINHRSGGLI